MAQRSLYPANGATHTAVPREFVEAIVRAFQQTPAARALEADLTTSSETPFLLEEFLYALSFGGSSTPNESGRSYRLLQFAPLSAQEEIFEHLQEFWKASTTPDQWQLVLLILIQKMSISRMGRPIGLIEVLLKVRTKMVTCRILPLLDTHLMLQPNQFAFLSDRGFSSKRIQSLMYQSRSRRTTSWCT
jgi:hypothetical protein